MEPIRETAEAVKEIEPFADQTGLIEKLREYGRRVQEVVPDCVGLSLASTTHGVTFTLVASDVEIAVLDAFQYLAGGPCVDALQGERVLEACYLPTEAEWQLFARATAEVGVASTLTLPIVTDGRVTGTVDLYGASGNAFTGHHQQLAEIFDAWAPGAVTNADLSFRTRTEARKAPQRLRDQATVDQAAGVVAASEKVTPDQARDLIREAAQCAGVTEVQLAERLISLRSRERHDH